MVGYAVILLGLDPSLTAAASQGILGIYVRSRWTTVRTFHVIMVETVPQSWEVTNAHVPKALKERIVQ